MASPLVSDEQKPVADFVDLSTIAHVALDLRYATTNNFMGQDLYGEFRRALLHPLAADKLRKAAADLDKLKPGWKLLIYDALRPRSVQRKLWDKVKGTSQRSYVADPEKGSVHNFGMAVDLGIQEEQGRELDMGCPFDTLDKISEPRREEEMLKAGRLSDTQISNRRILRNVMVGAGFIQQSNEWWHYDALPRARVRREFKIVE